MTNTSATSATRQAAGHAVGFRVFLNYRPDDAGGYAGRLYDALAARFGTDGVFMDVNTIEAGADIGDTIREAVSSCDALVVLIGGRWLTASDAAGARRLEDPDDFVRVEIEAALARGVRIIPTLIEAAEMPSPSELPESIRPLSLRNAVEISNKRWCHDIAQLIAALEGSERTRGGEASALPLAEAAPSRRPGSAELPSGAITFLLTDIEGSTRLLKQLRERYAGVLADHQRLLRAAFVAHRGHEVDTQGDSFFVAFASARDALLAAVEGQLALLSYPWPDSIQVKVRMGLHTGQAVATGGRYTGLAVHRTARICAAGHGGQVLVSHATQTILEDEEEDLGIRLLDLGEQRLKDLDRPVRLYQAASDRLPSSFPTIRHEGHLAQAAGAAIGVPLWRRPSALVASALAVAALVAGAVLLATRHTGGGLSGVSPNHVGVIDPKTNEIVAEVPVGIRPGPVAVGAGAVWVGNLEDRTLTRINTRQRAIAGTLSLDNRTPTGITVGAGAVWVAHGLRGQLSRVDPQFNRVTNTLDVTRSPIGLQGAVAVGAGSVWAVYGDSTLARIEPADARVLGSTLAGASPAAVVLGSGSVWVANSGDATVYRYNPGTFEEGPVTTPINVGRQPSGIAFGQGAVWVANADDDAVTRIDPRESSTITIPVGDGPVSIAVGAGAVWVVNRADGTLSRIDPATKKVVRTIHVGGAPSGIGVADGLVWVAVQAP